MDDLASIRLMGPAEFEFGQVRWRFSRRLHRTSFILSFFPKSRTWNMAEINGGSESFPTVRLETLISLLPEEEKAKATAASLGVYPWKNETD